MNEQPKYEVSEEKFRDFFVSAEEPKGKIDFPDVNTLVSELNLDNTQIDKIYEVREQIISRFLTVAMRKILMKKCF